MILPRPLFTCSISMRALPRFACARVWMVQRSMVPSAFLREEKKDLLPISISGGRVFASRTQHKQRTIKLHKKKSLHSVGLDMLGCNRNVNSKHCDRGTVALRRKQSLDFFVMSCHETFARRPASTRWSVEHSFNWPLRMFFCFPCYILFRGTRRERAPADGW